MKPIPASVSDKLETLQAKIQDHVELAQLCMEADGGNVHTPDLWINAGIRRSMQVLDGFTAMVRARNISSPELCCASKSTLRCVYLPVHA